MGGGGAFKHLLFQVPGAGEYRALDGEVRTKLQEH